MSDPVLDITKYLNEGTGDLDWLVRYSDGGGNASLFMLDMPPSPDNAAAIYRYEGGPPKETFGNVVHTRNPRIQIVVRHKFSEEALKRADQIMLYLAPVKDQIINGTRYARIKPVGEPSEIGPDEQGRQRAVVNFAVSYYDSL